MTTVIASNRCIFAPVATLKLSTSVTGAGFTVNWPGSVDTIVCWSQKGGYSAPLFFGVFDDFFTSLDIPFVVVYVSVLSSK